MRLASAEVAVLKRLEGLAVAIIFIALAFLVYRDVSSHKILQISGFGGQAAEIPIARTAVEQLCRQNGGCSSIAPVAHVAETANTYEQVAYLVTLPDNTTQVIVVVSLEAGQVVHVR